jgi:hypothetical protein
VLVFPTNSYHQSFALKTPNSNSYNTKYTKLLKIENIFFKKTSLPFKILSCLYRQLSCGPEA